ncbi:MAG: 16S rRNA (guanine(966)-N(2))-methyltransferase RsmD [Bacteroidia bacterium]
MRIIGGTHKGRIVHPPGNLDLRPTTDFAKESLFNILNNRIYFEDCSVLDLFCGTGSISFEFASRGAKSVTAVDGNHNCTAFIKAEAAKLGFDKLFVLRSDVFKYLKSCSNKFDIIFADPPFALENIEEIHKLVFEKELLNPGGHLVIEHGKKTDLSSKTHFEELRTYGNVNFSIFRTPAENTENTI